MNRYSESIILDERMRKILRETVGKQLVEIRTDKPDQAAGIWGAIGLFFSDGTVIQIENIIMAKQYYNTMEDMGVLTVDIATEEHFSSGILNGELVTRRIEDRVAAVKIISDHIESAIGDVIYSLTADNAIVFELERGVLVFEKGWYFMEYICIHDTSDYMSRLRNAFDDYYDEESGSRPRCNRTVTIL